MNRVDDDGLQALELELLLQALHRRHGHDYRNYGRGSLMRRVRSYMVHSGISTISSLQSVLLRDRVVLESFVAHVSVSVTSMFRDPQVFAALRSKVVPLLRTYPFIRVWHAGCSTGEEVYSTAIVLEEEGLLERARVYATDISEPALRRAKQGQYGLSDLQGYEADYRASGGVRDFWGYFDREGDGGRVLPSLRRNVVFSRHSLVTDRSFNEFHLVFCRNVMIYFDASLRRRTHDLLHESTAPFGFLVLGLKETADYTPRSSTYGRIDERLRIYRRKP